MPRTNYCFLANKKALCGQFSNARVKIFVGSSTREKCKLTRSKNRFFFCIIAYGSEIFSLIHCRERFNTKFMITNFLIMENPFFYMKPRAFRDGSGGIFRINNIFHRKKQKLVVLFKRNLSNKFWDFWRSYSKHWFNHVFKNMHLMTQSLYSRGLTKKKTSKDQSVCVVGCRALYSSCQIPTKSRQNCPIIYPSAPPPPHPRTVKNARKVSQCSSLSFVGNHKFLSQMHKSDFGIMGKDCGGRF